MATDRDALVTEAKQLSDKANTSFVTDAQWAIWANQGVRRLWRFIMRHNPGRLEVTTDFTLTASDNTFTLPTGLHRIRSIERDPGGPGRYVLRHSTVTSKNQQNSRLPTYRRNKTDIIVEPKEWAAGDYRCYYVAAPTNLPAGSTEMDDELDFWWEFPAIYAAIRGQMKARHDSSELRAALAELQDEIIAWCNHEDGAMPATITDVDDLGDPDYLYNRRV